MSTSQVSLLSQAGIPFRGPLTRPVLYAILEPWLVAHQPARFQAFELGFFDDDPMEGYPRLSDGRRALGMFLGSMSLDVLGLRAHSAGDRLGSAVIRQSEGDGDEYRYHVLLELPLDVTNGQFVHAAAVRWSTGYIRTAERPLCRVEQWIDAVAKADTDRAYIDSLETWAWRAPRGWNLSRDSQPLILPSVAAISETPARYSIN
jgi:hypothetical protein